jgi:hypothetical protein
MAAASKGVRVARRGPVSRAVLETIVQDVTYGLRQLRTRPSFSIVAVSTLALGGVRVAFGARPVQVVWVVIRDALWPVTLGLSGGLVGTYFATRLIGSFLFQTTPHDPLTLVVVVAALVLATSLAAWVPARRAAHVDPISALRAE